MRFYAGKIPSKCRTLPFRDFPEKQARKSSEDAQAAGYTRLEKSLGRASFGSTKFGPKILRKLKKNRES